MSILTKTKQEIDELVSNNTKLVYQVINDRYRKYITDKMATVDDLYSEGLLGLYKAAKAFNPAKKIKFSTFAYLLIRQSISRYLWPLRKKYNIRPLIKEDLIRDENENYFKIRRPSNPNASINLIPYIERLPNQDRQLIENVFYKKNGALFYKKTYGINYPNFVKLREKALTNLASLLPPHITENYQ